MGSELTTAETGLDLPLAEPHFDDEATVLSARPVVPLDEVPVDELESYEKQRSSRFARGWVFAATVAGAMLLGAVVAIAYFSYVNRQPIQPAVSDDGIVAGAEGLAIEPTGNSGASVTTAEARSPAADTPVAVKEAPAVSQPEVSSRETRKPVARRVAVLTFPSSHEERKEARRLAKQQRKEIEHESRNRNLTRIREIFEGPQRP
jgi:hypothetical protein